MFCAKVRALGCKVIGFDAYYKPNAADGTEYIEAVSLEELYRRADVISVNCPLTDETRHLVSDAAFALMKPTAYVVNVSRGGIGSESPITHRSFTPSPSSRRPPRITSYNVCYTKLLRDLRPEEKQLEMRPRICRQPEG